jgi:HMG (high mobility group) box
MVARLLGKQWQDEPKEVRAAYKVKALERKAEHLRMHPNYQYAPRRPGVKKQRASRKDKKASADKDQYESLRFIDEESEYYGAPDFDHRTDGDAMDTIGTKQDDGIRRFHIDGDGNIGVSLPIAEEVDITKMVEANNRRAANEGDTYKFNPTNDLQVADFNPPHVQNDTDFFDALIDWDGVAEDYKAIQEISGEEIAGLRDCETGNPYLSLSNEDQRVLFEAELERALTYFD